MFDVDKPELPQTLRGLPGPPPSTVVCVPFLSTSDVSALTVVLSRTFEPLSTSLGLHHDPVFVGGQHESNCYPHPLPYDDPHVLLCCIAG
jgi:hypothetical protein